MIKDKYKKEHFWKDPKPEDTEAENPEAKPEKKKMKLKLNIPSGKKKR